MRIAAAPNESIFPHVPRGATPAAPPDPQPVVRESPFAKLLSALGRETDQGERLMRQAMTATQGGHEYGTTELLALQAGVYRYSEVIDLAAKLVDRAANGVKTVLSGQ